MKPYPSKISIKIGPIEKVYEGRETPSLVLIKPKLKSPDPLDVIRDIQEFHLDDQCLVPYMEWVHNLYIYPLSVNMTTFSGKINARNLCLQVVLKDNDAVPTVETKNKDIFGQSRDPNDVELAQTAVQYHEPKPNFYEEIKIRLPSNLVPQHHLFFAVQQVQCKPQSKKTKGDPVTVPVAFAYIPLVSEDSKYVTQSLSLSLSLTHCWGLLDRNFLPDGEHGVPTAYLFPKSYMQPEADEQTKWFDREKKKPNLFFRSKLVSTLVPQNPLLAEFFSMYHLWQDSPRFVDVRADFPLLHLMVVLVLIVVLSHVGHQRIA